MNRSFDVVVVGGGHAGIEAAAAAARIGVETALLTFSADSIGRMSCNPAIGGVAKGQLVREIDALGGWMGRWADRAGIQFRMLNTSKGPAVWGPRAQQDMYQYAAIAQRDVATIPHLSIVEGELLSFEKEGNQFSLSLANGQTLQCRAVVITTGTFLNGMMYTGSHASVGGRIDEPAATALALDLARHNITLRRLKTGTPMRVDGNSLNYDAMTPQQGDAVPFPFSSWTTTPLRNSALCWTTRTNATTHNIIRAGFTHSPLFDGSIKGLGPRYCPGIEDKVSQFPDRTSHLLFAEPESADGSRIYLNGFNSSLPAQVQEEAVRTVPGFENAQILVPGYDIDYDAISATELHATLEHRHHPGLYFAGQVNGTSGYEEAAAQGLVAGANAALALLDKKPLIIHRSQGYSGVLIDDLTTMVIPEPYRMFTSRAEYRLLLRQDNTESRLLQKGIDAGLISPEQRERYLASRQRLLEAEQKLAAKILHPIHANPLLESRGEQPISQPTAAYDLLRRGEAPVQQLLALVELSQPLTQQEEVEIWANALYASYHKRLEQEIALRSQWSDLEIPPHFDYLSCPNLSNEGRTALQQRRPRTMGEAEKIAGVRPTDLSTLYRVLQSGR